MGAVIDIRTRKPRPEPVPVQVSDAQRVSDFTNYCEDSIWANALKIRAVQGLDRALRALHRAADELRNAGNPNRSNVEPSHE